jgi:hypothetical protein
MPKNKRKVTNDGKCPKLSLSCSGGDYYPICPVWPSDAGGWSFTSKQDY